MKIAQIMTHDVWGGIGPEKLDEGIGGREGAMIRLAREWARKGHQVTNFVAADESIRHVEGEGFHEYVPIGISRACLGNFEYDACVSWECPSVFDHPKIVAKQPVRLVEMQCAHFYSEGEKLAAEKAATGVVALSDWARDFLVHDGLRMDADKLHVLPNCIDLEHYPEMEVPEAKLDGPFKIFYSSSPDRGLVHLLRVWPYVINAQPQAQLFVGYGVSKWVDNMVWSHGRPGQMAMDIAIGMKQDGIVDLGKVGQAELAAIQRDCQLWVYPCDTIQPTETGCITALEAMAAYAPAVITDCDCLAEEFGDVATVVPLPFLKEEFMPAMSAALEPDVWFDNALRGREFAEGRQWKDVADRWTELFRIEKERF